MKTKRAKYLSIHEAVMMVENHHRRLEKFRILVGYESADIGLKFRNFIGMANSLGIVLIQHKRYSEAFMVLNKSLKAEQVISKSPSFGI